MLITETERSRRVSSPPLRQRRQTCSLAQRLWYFQEIPQAIPKTILGDHNSLVTSPAKMPGTWTSSVTQFASGIARTHGVVSKSPVLS
jgi:hypothetical protein